MNSENLKLAGQLIKKSYIDQGQDSLQSRQNLYKVLLTQRNMPDVGWDDLTIEHFLNSLALMDTNNFQNKIGVGERESRIYRFI